MPSLAEITRDTRIIGKFSAIGLVVIIFLFFSFKGIVFIYSALNPPVIAPPGQELGEITTELPIPPGQKNYTYRINTITGELPTFPDRIRVYKIAQPDPDLLGLQRAREYARQKGFLNGETLTKPNTYRWNNDFGGTFEFNILSKNFSVRSGIGYEDTGYRFQSATYPASSVMSYLNSLDISTEDFDTDQTKIVFFKASGTAITPSNDPTESLIAQVSLFQKPIKVDPFVVHKDKAEEISALPIYYTDPKVSNQFFIVKAATQGTAQIVTADFHHFYADPTQYGMYPLKTVQAAYAALESGQAMIFSTNNEGTIDITDVTLGYYIPETEEEFVIPIFVFTGKDFIAYVNALGAAISPEPNQNVTN